MNFLSYSSCVSFYCCNSPMLNSFLSESMKNVHTKRKFLMMSFFFFLGLWVAYQYPSSSCDPSDTHPQHGCGYTSPFTMKTMCSYYRKIDHWQHTERILSPKHHELCLTSPWNHICLMKVLQTKILRIEDIIQCCFISAISEWNMLEHQDKCKMLESNTYSLKKAFPSLF